MRYEIRASKKADEKGLRALWTAVFGDEDDFLNPFFDIFGAESAFLCEKDGKIISAVYPLDVGYFVSPDGEKTPCRMIYALATLPEYRGENCASGLMEYCRDENAVYVLKPAGGSLFKFYQKLGYTAHFKCREEVFMYEDLPQSGNSRAVRLTAHSYGEERERLLKGTAHIAYNGAALSFESFISGGRMFKITGGGFEAAAVVEADGGTAHIKELIAPRGHISEAVSAIHEAVRFERYHVRTIGNGDDDIFAMATGKVNFGNNAWYGFSFD